MTAIAILSPGHPHNPGGVTDHSSRLVRHWSEAGRSVAITGNLDEAPEQVVSRWISAGVGSALIQYVPFLYGRRGLSGYPARLASEARRAGLRTAVFVHEPWVPPTRLPWLILGPLQRRQLRGLLREASVAVTAVPAWQSLLTPRPELIYVGSTLPAAPAGNRPEPEFPSPVVFSPFAAGLNWEWISAAVRALGTGLTIIGTTEALARQHRLARWIEPGWQWLGRVPAATAVVLLSRARVVLAPYIDGVTGRRTSICGALSVGVRVLSSTGHLFDPFFQAAVQVAADAADFAERAARLWRTPDSADERRRRIEWYQQNLDTRILDTRLLHLLTDSRS